VAGLGSGGAAYGVSDERGGIIMFAGALAQLAQARAPPRSCLDGHPAVALAQLLAHATRRRYPTRLTYHHHRTRHAHLDDTAT
jgi:hypothetical protein